MCVPQCIQVLFLLAGPGFPTVAEREITRVGEGHGVYVGQGDVSLLQLDRVRLQIQVQFLTSPIQADVHIFTWAEHIKTVDNRQISQGETRAVVFKQRLLRTVWAEKLPYPSEVHLLNKRRVMIIFHWVMSWNEFQTYFITHTVLSWTEQVDFECFSYHSTATHDTSWFVNV